MVSALFLAAPGLAQASEDSATTNGTQPPPTAGSTGNSGSSASGADDERQICRRIETNTGSRVPHRLVCMTEREWRIFNRQD